MKASVEFRGDEDRPPLVRAKVPIHVLGLPFKSAVSLGTAADLRFDFTSAVDSFPALRLSYRPADHGNPFSLVVKSGTGALGSPVGAPMSISAEFNLLGAGGPRFFVYFRPAVGDFCLKRLVKEESVTKNGLLEEIHSPAKVIERVLSGTEIIARSVLPVKSRAAVRVRWGVRVPSELNTVEVGGSGSGGSYGMKLPHLVMSKISVEYFGDRSKEKTDAGNLSIQRQLDAMRAESRMLRKAVEDLRSEFAGGREGKRRENGNRNGAREGKGTEDGDWRGGKRAAPPTTRPVRKGADVATTAKDNVNEELKKALMEATGAHT